MWSFRHRNAPPARPYARLNFEADVPERLGLARAIVEAHAREDHRWRRVMAVRIPVAVVLPPWCRESECPTPGPSATGTGSSWIAKSRREAASVSISCFMVRAMSDTGAKAATERTTDSISSGREMFPFVSSQTPTVSTTSPPSAVIASMNPI